MSKRRIPAAIASCLVIIFFAPICTRALADDASPAPDATRPNILWIIVEDMSAHFGCYGETTITTPNVDALAADGARFSRAFVTAPVCSAARSALITGMYQTSIGAHHHRSGRGRLKIQLPPHVVPVPELFRRADYYTSNGALENRGKRLAKTDYNFAHSESLYDGNDWSGRREGQPFFAQIQLRGGKMRHGDRFARQAKKTLGSLTKSEDVTLPPYYPSDPVILDDWAHYLDTVRFTDAEVGRIIQRLDDEGLTENTYVFFITDHGISHVRAKQFCYEAGIHIPFIVRGPHVPGGTIRDDLTLQIDMPATSLALAGIPVPEWMEGRDLFADDQNDPRYVVAARDRCDETVDHIRCVRSIHFKYIRNFLPERPYLQPNTYKDGKPIQLTMRRLHAEGRLDRNQSLIMADRRPSEELYDLRTDPHELHNLAANPQREHDLKRHRAMLEEWIEETGDQGRNPEPIEMYDSDMTAYVEGHQRRSKKRAETIRANIRLMKEWAVAGR